VEAVGVSESLVKVLGLVRGRSPEDLFELQGSGPGVRGFVVSEVVDFLVPGIAADAFVEQWLEAGTVWVPPRGLDATWWLTTEHIFKRRRPDQARPGTVKVIGSAYKRDDLTTRAFFDYWRDVHADISGRAPGLGAYVVSEVLERLGGDIEADGFVEQWWPDRATLDRASASPEVAIAWEDVQKYARPVGTFWITREHVVVPPLPDDPGSLER
jgi:uncharacterized protein (TIGR02118 family)